MFGRVLTSAAKGVSVTLPTARASSPLLIRVSAGRLARLAPASAVLSANNTTILATLSQTSPQLHSSFLPLLIDFRSKAAAVGIIPGTWTRRELQPAVQETLTARLIDRSLRPALSAPNVNLPPTQLTVSVLSAEQVSGAPVDALAVNAAAAVVAAAGIPCAGIGAARVALVGGEVVEFPGEEELDRADVSVFVAVNGEGRVLSMSVEGITGGVADGELMRVVREAMKVAKRFAGLQDEFRERVMEMKREEGESSFPRQMPKRAGGVEESVVISDDILKGVRVRAMEVYCEAFVECRTFPGKAHRADVVTRAQQSLVDEFPDVPMEEVLQVARGAAKEAHRAVLLRDGLRMDGRAFDEVRLIRCERGFLPGQVHGSALFERGDTQVLACSTIGLKSQAMRLEKYVTGGDEEKSFFVHYSFPPYATGEYGRFAGTASRREVGHSDMAEKAIKPLLDFSTNSNGDGVKNMQSAKEDSTYPYSHRISAEVMASDGSSSMAAVCAGSIALMDSGAPLRTPVAGVAMGLITGPGFNNGIDSDFIVLTDILGAEDHFGDMDMKVTGTADRVTACQLDVKPYTGLPAEVIEQALLKAQKARVEILAKMAEIATEAGAMPDHAPRVVELAVDHNVAITTLMKDRAKGLREIEDRSGVNLNYDGQRQVVTVEAPNHPSSQNAVKMIQEALRNLDIGTKLEGKVTDVKQNYAVVTVAFGNVSGLLHVSKMQLNSAGMAQEGMSEVSSARTMRYPDARNVLSRGDKLEVVVLESDRSRNILRLGLSSPLEVSPSERLTKQIDSILAESLPTKIEVK